MAETTLADEAEQYLRILAEPDSEPGEHECLACYVARMLTAHGCDTTLRWAKRFRDLRVPTATALERRLGSVGGYCDCEILLNGYGLVRELLVRDIDTDELEPPAVPPVCAGVRRSSAKPCINWERRSRYPRW